MKILSFQDKTNLVEKYFKNYVPYFQSNGEDISFLNLKYESIYIQYLLEKMEINFSFKDNRLSVNINDIIIYDRKQKIKKV